MELGLVGDPAGSDAIFGINGAPGIG